MTQLNCSIAVDVAVPAAANPPRTVVGATHATIDSIMTRKVISVSPDTTVESLVELMLFKGLSRIPVVDADGRPIGMVAKTDLVENQFEASESEEEADEPVIRAKGGIGYRLTSLKGQTLRTVRELMTDTAVTVQLGTTIREAARLMSMQNLHGMPVVDGAGKLVGVVSALDLVGWLAREC